MPLSPPAGANSTDAQQTQCPAATASASVHSPGHGMTNDSLASGGSCGISRDGSNEASGLADYPRQVLHIGPAFHHGDKFVMRWGMVAGAAAVFKCFDFSHAASAEDDMLQERNILVRMSAIQGRSVPQVLMCGSTHHRLLGFLAYSAGDRTLALGCT
ncbi:hypothetical protein WJX74_009751 [Apatococcus lobatus]|uniref:Uncharacterized protein n=1 Tax=Apatococcus lobatus TaxID=904363 RepID=A0AAW1RXA7_9CHLO